MASKSVIILRKFDKLMYTERCMFGIRNLSMFDGSFVRVLVVEVVKVPGPSRVRD